MDERDGEIAYQIDDRISNDEDGPYPEPDVGAEIQRLEEAYVAAGGNPTKPTAWAEGESHVEKAAWLRKILRNQRDAGACGLVGATGSENPGSVTTTVAGSFRRTHDAPPVAKVDAPMRGPGRAGLTLERTPRFTLTA